jgi:hypothetical protein
MRKPIENMHKSDAGFPCHLANGKAFLFIDSNTSQVSRRNMTKQEKERKSQSLGLLSREGYLFRTSLLLNCQHNGVSVSPVAGGEGIPALCGICPHASRNETYPE